MEVAGSPPRRGMWTCECGRKVPATVDQCRCGNAKPVETPAPAGPDLSGAADWVEKQSESPAAGKKESVFSYRGYQQLATAAIVVALYFGGRHYVQWSTSREARSQLINALTPSMGADSAERVASLYHAACFEATYHVAWGRRGSWASSKFDAEKYVVCVAKKAKLTHSP